MNETEKLGIHSATSEIGKVKAKKITLFARSKRKKIFKDVDYVSHG
jgi:hypothetical protein